MFSTPTPLSFVNGLYPGIRCEPLPFWGQKQGNNQKTYKMVGNNLDMHVLSTLARSAYANSPSQPIFSVLISYFSGTL